MLSKELKSALAECIGRKIPFFLFRDRNATPEFFSAPEGLESNDIWPFTIHPWGDKVDDIEFRGRLDAGGTINYLRNHPKAQAVVADSGMPVWRDATREDDYIRSLSQLVPQLKDTGRKTVVSTALCGSSQGVDWVSVAEDLFDRFPTAYGFFYYTPETGFWLGASPETLLQYSDGEFGTMALAGTRLTGIQEAWDDKNTAEHEYVRRYICGVFESCGLEAVCGPKQSLAYGKIEHLCTPVSARGPVDKFLPLLNGLHPTPAMCGYPTEAAKRDIAAIEHHPRQCYSGYILIGGKENPRKAFVNLRCVHFGSESWCVYAGGGIVGTSDPAEEWSETRRKASALLSLIGKYGGKDKNAATKSK